ncbi:MAG: PEP-CTERM sorting domain-containing protein [Wenzhouxiangella sp.]|jgi:hypothetical protein|nr:PEP-CTERM sorting domain-containing protein [Wenzhouxiangella sp.]
MLKQLRNTAVAAAASLVFVLPAQAAIVFDAQFTETFFGLEDAESVDSVLDQFLFSLVQEGPGTYDVTIDAVFIYMNDPIVTDLDPALPAPNGIGAGVDAYGEFVADGSGVFGLGFIGFGIGDGFAYNIDIDGIGPIVNGFSSSPGTVGSIFAGSTVEVVYTDNGVPNEEPLFFTFGACETPGAEVDCAQATGMIPATDLGGGTVPAPMTLALMGLGLLGLSGRRRRHG